VLVHNNCLDDLGESWVPKPVAEVCGTNTCTQTAREIQSKIGGDVYRATDHFGAKSVGEIRDLNNPEAWYESGWAYHDVLIKDGRVFDATTGRYGLSFEEYRKKFRYGEYLDFTPQP
jgi:hypothetical protein